MAGTSHLICGDDDFLVAQAASLLLDRLVPAENRSLALETVDGRVDTVDEGIAAVRRVVESLETPGFFGAIKLTWLREPSFLGGGRTGDAALMKERVADLTAVVKRGLPDGQVLLVTAARINRNSALFRALQAKGEVQDFGSGAKPYQQAQIAAQRLVELLPRFGLQMDATVRQQFVATVGTSTRILVNELEKLRLYLGKDGPVTAADIQSVSSPGHEAEVWDLLDSFGERKLPLLVASLHAQFDQSDNLIGLVAMLEGRLRDLLIVREALDRGWAVSSGSGGSVQLAWKAVPPDIEAWMTAGDGDFRALNPYRQGRLAAQAGRWTLRELRLARHQLLELREALVSSPLPAELLIENALLRMAGRPRGGSARTETGKTA